MRRPLAMRPLDRLTSIRAKLGSVIVFAVGMTVVLMYVAIGLALHTEDRYRQDQLLEIQASNLSAIGFLASGEPAPGLSRAIAHEKLPVFIITVDGRILADGFRPPSPRALSGLQDRGSLDGEDYVGVPVSRGHQVVGAVYLLRKGQGGGIMGAIRGTAGFIFRVWWQLLLAGAASAIIALALARWLARGMTQPIRDMAKGAESLARGDYSGRVPVTTRDELGKLAETFNRMAGELESLERLRRDLVANVSHELKTPITAIRAHLENLLDGVEEPNAATVGVMLEQSERLGRLVDQLLDLSRLESGAFALELDFVTLRPLVGRVIREVQVGRPAHGVELRDDVPSELPPVEVDRERIHQVLFNLLDNALRFTAAGGTISVSASLDGDLCRVSVEDSGPGIPEAHTPFVFERFYRVDPARSRDGGGTGIGLTIARSVVEAHGGTIWVERSAAGGAAFRFTLPLAAPPVGDAKATAVRAGKHDPEREQAGPVPARAPAAPGSTRVGARRA